MNTVFPSITAALVCRLAREPTRLPYTVVYSPASAATCFEQVDTQLQQLLSVQSVALHGPR